MSSCSLRVSPETPSLNCKVAVAGNVINIYPDRPGVEMLVWNANSLSSCSYVGGKLTARYKDAELSCYGEPAGQVYNAWLEKDKVFPENSGGRTFRNLVITITLLFIALFAAVYFLVLPWAAEKAAHLIPKDMEVELGEKMSAHFRQGQHPGVADSLLNVFAANIDFDSDYPLKLHVLQSPDINAFAVPGGNIFVYTGIIAKMDSYEQLAALLAHEVTHVEKRHSLRSVCRSLASGLMIATIFGDAGGISGAIINQADQFRNLGYSRELETEADLHGLQVLKANSIPQKGMLELLALLDREGAKAPGLMKYLSTHPETAERIESVKQNVVDDGEQDGKEQRLAEIFEKLKMKLD